MNSKATENARWIRRRAMPKTLGVVMIVKNEAENLPELFRGIAEVADEVVVVDTGSTDGTLAVCRAWGVKVVQEPWRDDFSHARNRSIEEARARYLLWLDADDRLPPRTQEGLRRLREGELQLRDDRAYRFEVRNLDRAGEPVDAFLQLRLFPRRPGVCFRGAVHEQVAPSLAEAGVGVVRSDLVVLHTGYAEPEVERAKTARNQRLLREALERDPDDLQARSQMALVFLELGQERAAEEQFSAVLAGLVRTGSSPEVLAELYAMRARPRVALGDADGAVRDLERAIELHPGWALPYAALAEVYALRGDWDAVLPLTERARAASLEPGMFAFRFARVRRNVELFAGCALLERGDPAEGGACLLRALEVEPEDLELRLTVGQLLLDAGRFPEARGVLEPAGRDERALPHFVEVSAAIGLARAMTGDESGAVACLAPLLGVFAQQCGGAEEVGPQELAGAMLRAGHETAARNMATLARRF